MKHIVAVILLLIPFSTFAAPLTIEQANSLIGVVQSSPQTPASAFTDLITAFSNITVQQANSLIVVVQAAPGVPASAFVNMLVAFTEDSTSNNMSQESTNNTQQPTVTVGAVTDIEELSVNVITQEPNAVLPMGRYYFNIKFLKNSVPQDGKLIHIDYPSDHDSSSAYVGDDLRDKTLGTMGVQFGPYIPTTKGTKTITFTSGGVSKSVTVVVE